MVMTTSSSSMRSSTSKSSTSMSKEVLRSSPYFSLISVSSSLMMFNTSCSSAKIALYSAIIFCISAYSSSIFSRSRPVRRWRRMSRIACAWISVRAKRSMSWTLASLPSLAARISAMTSSMLSRAMRRPSRICALASAFFKSKMVLLVMISFWCST